MAHIIYFVKGDPSIVASYKKALEPIGDFDFIVVAAKPDGLSSAYGKLADDLKDSTTGRILPGLYAKYGTPRAPYDTITLATFSAGYKFAERTLAIADDADELDAYVAIDSIHADFDEDHSAKDAQIEPFVKFAKRAKTCEKVFWIGHSDVVTPQVGPGSYASTTQVRNEIVRLAGGEGGHFRTRSHNLETSPVKEHVAAIQKWGPGYLAEAMKALIQP